MTPVEPVELLERVNGWQGNSTETYAYIDRYDDTITLYVHAKDDGYTVAGYRGLTPEQALAIVTLLQAADAIAGGAEVRSSNLRAAPVTDNLGERWVEVGDVRHPDEASRAATEAEA